MKKTRNTALWRRWPLENPEAVEVILDEPLLAEGRDYFSLGSFSVSHDGRYLAYSTDVSGAERYTLRIKHLTDGRLLEDVIENTRGNAIWAADNHTLFYLVVNESWRSHQVRRHRLGESAAEDVIVYQEADSGFSVDVDQSSSRQYILISTGDQVTTEEYLIPSERPETEPRLILARRANHEYEVDHQGDRFVIRSNDQHQNFRLATAPGDDLSESSMDYPEAKARTHATCVGFNVSIDGFALAERVEGLDQIRLIDREGESKYIEFPEPVYTASLGARTLST